MSILLSLYLIVAVVFTGYYFVASLSDPNTEAFTAAFWAMLTGVAWPVVILYWITGEFRK